MKGTIKERQLKRFTDAREKLGPNWRKIVKAFDDFYRTDEGHEQMVRVVGSVTSPRRAGADVIERLADSMEDTISKLFAEV